MTKFGLILVLITVVQVVVGPPVTQKKGGSENANEENEINENDHMASIGIEYNRYLREVVTALESDSQFREKLEKADEVDIRTGKIAQELDYVNHQVRTKLDELKRQEIERLRHLATKNFELNKGIDTEHLKIIPEHLDHSNPHTFEVEDLVKLISKTTADLAEADRQRRNEFKEYEMQKEFEKQEKLKTLDEEQRKKLEEEYKQQELKHKQHEPLHHPGSKQQLEEVWEKEDHMDSQEFNPKTFFHLHDLDGNGFWDEVEVKALFRKELDKMFQAGLPEDDMRERIEEMERMREHVFGETDKNKDRLISFEEFLEQTKKPEFEKDDGWEGIDDQQIYTPEEFREFEKHRQEEIQRMIANGLIPPHPNGMPSQYGVHPPNLQQQFPHQQQGQLHPNQIPQYQGHPNQAQFQGQVHPNQYPQGQFQGQAHPNQYPQGQFQGQAHPNQYPQGQFQGQVHPNQIHPNQVQYQGQVHPNQYPQGQFQGQAQPNQGQFQGQAQPNQGQFQGQAQPNQGQFQGQAQPNQGQFQGQVHPNQVQFQPGAVQPNQVQQTGSGQLNPPPPPQQGQPQPSQVQAQEQNAVPQQEVPHQAQAQQNLPNQPQQSNSQSPPQTAVPQEQQANVKIPVPIIEHPRQPMGSQQNEQTQGEKAVNSNLNNVVPDVKQIS